MSKPYVIAAHSIREYGNYYDYLVDRFENINFGDNSPYYVQGCTEAINLCLDYLHNNPNNLSGMMSFIKTRRSASSRRVKDAYMQGHLEGYLLVTDALNEAKMELLEETKKAIATLK